MDYYDRAGLTPYLEKLGFNLVGFGCTTCIGNSGPLPPEISAGRQRRTTWPSPRCCPATATSRAASTPTCRMNYLASPPLVVAYALAGTMDVDLYDRAARHRHRRRARVPARHLARPAPRSPRSWPRPSSPRCSARATAHVFEGDERWQALDVPDGRPLRLGRRVHLRPPAAVLRRHGGRAPRRSPTSPAPGCWPCWATASPPTTSRPPAPSSADGPAGRYLHEHGVDAGRLQLLRLPPRATTR